MEPEDIDKAAAREYKELVSLFDSTKQAKKSPDDGFFGHERPFTSGLSLILNGPWGRDVPGSACHQFTVGTGPIASDLVWLHDGAHYLNAEGKVGSEGISTIPALLKEARGEVANQCVRLAIRSALYDDLTGRATTPSSGHHPFLICYWAPSVLYVTLCIPCTVSSPLVQWVGGFPASKDVDKIQYVEVDCFRLECSANETNRWAHVFRGLREGLKLVQGARQAHNVKTAIISPLPSVNVPVSRLIDGSDHLLVFEDEGRRWVAKTFCYYGRETLVADPLSKQIPKQNLVTPLMPDVREVPLEQQRCPPPDVLLKLLCEKFPRQYGEWSVEEVLPGYSVLKMPLIEGALAAPTGLGQWLDILNIVKLLHDQGFVHGDILDRNLLFPPKLEDGTEQPALVIDFDFCKPEDSLYPLGFVFEEFAERSGLNLKRGAIAEQYPPMKKAHDLHALKVLTGQYFELDVETVATVEGLVQKVEKTKPKLKSGTESLPEPKATKSPPRMQGRLTDIAE
jgi:hypothetical protein